MKRLLLDTHVLIWYELEPDKLTKSDIDEISDPVNEVYVSKVSFFELAIATRLNRLVLKSSISNFLSKLEKENRFRILDIKPDHLDSFLQIIPVKGHKDPFDFLLISQSKCENLELITYDQKIRLYFDQ